MKKSVVLLLLLSLLLLTACAKNTSSIDLFYPMENEVEHHVEDVKTFLTSTIDEMTVDDEHDVTHSLDIIDRSYYDFYHLDDFDINNDDDLIKVKAYLDLILSEVKDLKKFTENEYISVNDQRKIKICLEDEAIKIETISSYKQSNQFFYHTTYIGKNAQGRMFQDKLTFEYDLDHRNLVISSRETYVFGESSEVILIDHERNRMSIKSYNYEIMSFLYYSTFFDESIKYKNQDNPFEYYKLGERKEINFYNNHRILGYFEIDMDQIEATFNLLEIPGWNQLIRVSDILDDYLVMQGDQVLTDATATLSLSAYHLPYISYTIPIVDHGDYDIDEGLDLGVTYQEIIEAIQQFDLVIEQAMLELEFTENVEENISKMMEGIEYYPNDAVIKKYIKLF
jgi:hypothetical protein